MLVSRLHVDLCRLGAGQCRPDGSRRRSLR
ncbi:putative leader peptide [Microbispora oryzae]